MCAPVATRIAFILLPPLPITRLIAFGGTDTFLERNGEFINLPESSDCPLQITIIFRSELMVVDVLVVVTEVVDTDIALVTLFIIRLWKSHYWHVK
ncbi:hypothetical protein ALC57_09714 [Trachymyrmex cornetzi]|uniref:Secreted protein n=1 Tax=Trachymyrmex cornetzi TaxID=471704 RepID=A0A151J541_9HYME|nr:hypothetical protein ALC57_09714 [Trachymyrmex cornetzi]